MKHSYIGLTVFLSINYGCQTTTYQEVELSILKNRVFEQCEQGDGGLLVSVFHADENLLTSEVDWLAKDRSLAMEAYSSFGQTVGSMRFDLDRMRVATALPIKEADLIAIDDEMAVKYDDYYIGIQADELACYLAGRLPRNWLKKTIGADQREDQTILHMRVGDRNISVNLDKKTSEENRFCATVGWQRYLGLVKFSYKYCYDGKTKTASINYRDGLKITWKDLSH